MEKKDKKDTTFMRQKIPQFWKNNSELLIKHGKKPIVDAMNKIKDSPIKIDKNVIIQGIKNPLTLVLYGCSSRILYDAVKRKKKVVSYMCIIEPDIRILKHALMTEDWTDILDAPNIDIIVGIRGELLISQMFKALTMPIKGSAVSRSTLIENMEIVLDPFQYTTKEKIKQGKEEIRVIAETRQQIKLSMGCSDDQFRRYELMIANAKNMFNSWNIKNLYGKFADVPAFVLGGGPSLDEFIKTYNSDEKYKNSIIIAADAVLHKLLENGIKPHLVTRCERKLTNIFKGITKEKTKGIYYAAYPWTPPEFFELFDDSFYLFRRNGVCLFTELDHGAVDGGVSASNAGLELAILLGCRNIILSGVDLCMVGGKTHTDGTQVEFNIEASKARWTKVKTNGGGEATTIPVWQRCRREYAQSIFKHIEAQKKFKVYNMSKDGAVVELTEYKPLPDIDVFGEDMDAHKLIKKHRTKLTQKQQDKFNDMLKEAVERIKDFSNTIEISNSLAEDSKRTAEGELDKLVALIQTKAKTPYQLIMGLRAQEANVNKLWKGVADSYEDNFRKKLYTEMLFRILIFDVLQIDFYHYENQVNAMFNATKYEDERNYNFYVCTKEMLVKVLYYLEKFEKLFSEYVGSLSEKQESNDNKELDK